MTIVLFIETMEDPKISELKGSIDGWKVKLDVPSDMEIYGVERRELSHSHALAHIFRESFKHGSIENLLHVIKGRSSENHDCRKVLNKIGKSSLNVQGLDVKTEVGVVDGRCDIVMMAKLAGCGIDKLRIVLENKVYAKESNDQTSKYYSHYSIEEEPTVYLFLTPVTDTQTCSCPHFVHITYQDLYDGIFLPLIGESGVSESLKRFVESYIKALSLPTRESNKREIMALDMNMKAEIEKFFNQYGPYISDMLDILNADTNDTADARKAKECGRKISVQLAKHNGGEILKTLVFPLIERIAVRNNVQNYDDMAKLFPKSLISQKKQGGAHLIYTSDMLKDVKDNYGERFKIAVNGQEYHVLAYVPAWKDHWKEIIAYMENHSEYFEQEEVDEMRSALQKLDFTK